MQGSGFYPSGNRTGKKRSGREILRCGMRDCFTDVRFKSDSRLFRGPEFYREQPSAFQEPLYFFSRRAGRKLARVIAKHWIYLCRKRHGFCVLLSADESRNPLLCEFAPLLLKRNTFLQMIVFHKTHKCVNVRFSHFCFFSCSQNFSVMNQFRKFTRFTSSLSAGSNFAKLNRLKKVECSAELTKALSKTRGPTETFRNVELCEFAVVWRAFPRNSVGICVLSKDAFSHFKEISSKSWVFSKNFVVSWTCRAWSFEVGLQKYFEFCIFLEIQVFLFCGRERL